MTNPIFPDEGRGAGMLDTLCHEAPELVVSEWINTGGDMTLSALKGRVVCLIAFQMLCTGCLVYGLPQAERIHQAFHRDGLCVLGLHSVFEMHDEMSTEALRAFLATYRWSFPIGVDMPADRGAIPQTMMAYGMDGTPTTVLIDRQGRVRMQRLGRVDDVLLDVLVRQLLAE